MSAACINPRISGLERIVGADVRSPSDSQQLEGVADRLRPGLHTSHRKSVPGFGEQPELLRFENVSKHYGAVQALSRVSLIVPRGSVLALLGPNGAGKSTLFSCLLGLITPSSGTIHFNGEEISDNHRRQYGYLAERVALYPQRTVRENGLFFAALKGRPASEFETQLKRVGLHAVQNRRVRQLSKGMLQRLGLAIALCGAPEVLVLDEPFNGLDPALLGGLQRIVSEEQARGATLLISTHTMSAIEPLATHVAILLRGCLALSSTLADLREQYGGGESLETIYHRIARQANPEEVLL
jgi:ABC-type multidrug transport system ATPase subunit